MILSVLVVLLLDYIFSDSYYNNGCAAIDFIDKPYVKGCEP